MLHPARTIGVSKLRLFPKQRGLRPIVNMATTSIIRSRGNVRNFQEVNNDDASSKKRRCIPRMGGCFSKAWNSDGRSKRRKQSNRCTIRNVSSDENDGYSSNHGGGSNESSGSDSRSSNGGSGCGSGDGGHFTRSQSDGCFPTTRELSVDCSRHGLTKRAHSDSSLLKSKRHKIPREAQKPLGKLFRPVNSWFRPHFEVLKYEKDRNPGLLGASVFGLNEIYAKFKHFVGHVRAIAQTSKTPPTIYAVSVDLRHCFDTINREKLMGILSRVLSQENYCIQRYAVVHRAGSALRSKVPPFDQSSVGSVLGAQIGLSRIRYPKVYRRQ